MDYNVRSSDGCMKFKISGEFAKEIFDQIDGYFRNAMYANNQVLTVYEITDDMCVTIRPHLRLYFWEGDILQPIVEDANAICH